MQKDNLTDVVENLPEDDNDSEEMTDDSGNQQVISSEGETITLGEDDIQDTSM
jgi:hypothetical protein